MKTINLPTQEKAAEIAAESDRAPALFGLIEEEEESDRTELHGYEVTMSGRLVLPRLRPRIEELAA
jgi:hypothetical protein